MYIERCQLVESVIVCLMVLAILSLPVEFIWNPCCVILSLVRFVSMTLTRCISFSNLYSFLLKTCVSLFTQEKSRRSYLHDSVTAMIFVCLFHNANFLVYPRWACDSFLLMSFAPPQMTTKSLWYSWLISRRAKHVICSSLEPDIVVLITSKVSLSEDKSSAA